MTGTESRSVGWLLVALALSACTEGASTTTAVVDSAGIRVVTNLAGSAEMAEVWSLSAEPAVEIGSGINPDVPLAAVRAVVSLDGGRVAVGTNTPPQVLIFKPDGDLAMALGRQGAGPGEFSGVASVVPLGADSLGVWDDVRRRMSVFTVDGRHVRDEDLSALALLTPMAAGSDAVPAAWTYLLPSAGGSLVLFQVGVFGPGLGVRRVEVRSFRITTGGEELARFGPFPGEELFNFGAGQGGLVPFPFGANTFGATAGDALVVGTAEAPEFRLYDHAGALEAIVRWPDHDRHVEGPFVSDWTDFVDGWLAERPEGERSVIGDLLDRVPRPEHFPTYDGLITSETGEIWVGAYAGEHTTVFPPRNSPTPARRWLVFNTEGALRATAYTPGGFQPHALHEGLVWGVFRDELEVESVRAYKIVRP